MLEGMASGPLRATAAGGSRATRLGGWLLVAGGLVAAPLWLVFTTVHGPTSFNEDRITLGLDLHAWGLMLGVIPTVLVAGGYWLSRPQLVVGVGWAARLGHALSTIALLASAAIDLVGQGLGPPLLLPLLAAGLLLLGFGMRCYSEEDRTIRVVIVALGVVFAVAIAVALVPVQISDSAGGYRIYGAMVHLLGGFGWALLGWLLVRRGSTARDGR